MIRLFRKIRSQLLSEDNYFTYILYASGEILLVVIGILIALQLDNWNERRNQESEGEELASRLYQELLINKEYNIEVLEEYNYQYNMIRKLLDQGPMFNVDSLISATEDHWFIRAFSLTTYIFSFTEFYDPNFKLYKSSVADGSIKLVNNERLVSNLEEIYITGKDKLDRLYEREVSANKSIENHITENFSVLFSIQTKMVDGAWDKSTVKTIMEAILDDGAIRYLFQLKLAILKSKRSILGIDIMNSVEGAIESFEQ